MVGNRRFPCDGIHGEVDLVKAIRVSLQTRFSTKYGIEMGPDLIAAEATALVSIIPPALSCRPSSGTRAWQPRVAARQLEKKRQPAGTASGATAIPPTLPSARATRSSLTLQVVCMVCFVRPRRDRDQAHAAARSQPSRAAQRGVFGLAPAGLQYHPRGLGTMLPARHRALRQRGGPPRRCQTGTAQKGKIDLAWMVAFAPVENPQIAIAVVMEGTEGAKLPRFHPIAAPGREKHPRGWKAKRRTRAGKAGDVQVE